MTPVEIVDAKKTKLARAEAVRLARQASQLVVAKGKKVLRRDLRASPASDDELAELLLGPTGNLRAPTLRLGDTLLVGFSEEAYGELFGG